jgi:hypothetical protein
MRDAIVEKLDKFLSEPVDTECKAVYLFCEIRKLSDKDGYNLPLGLFMCANWALHVDLDRNKGADDFIKKIDGFVEEELNRTKDRLSFKSPTTFSDIDVWKEMCFIGSLRADLKKFFEHFGLQTTLCDDDEKWIKFVVAYAGVIEDGALTLSVSSKTPLNCVDGLVFRKGLPVETEKGFPFQFDWEIKLKGRGEPLRISLCFSDSLV